MSTRLEIREVTKECQHVGEVVNLLKESFPENELLSFEDLLDFTKTQNVYFWAFFDNNRFVGVAYFAHTEDMAFILYLAVLPTLRSFGYGSQILGVIKERLDGIPGYVPNSV